MYLNFFVTYVLDPTATGRGAMWLRGMQFLNPGHCGAPYAEALFPKAPGPIRLGPRLLREGLCR